MPAMEMLSHLIGINTRKFSRRELHILEATLFTCLCTELKNVFKMKQKDYFCLMRFNVEMEETMLEDNFVRSVINDILSTENYTLSGIAHYIQMPEDVIYEVISGRNKNPSAIFFRRILELHRLARSDLYAEIFKKILSENIQKT